MSQMIDDIEGTEVIMDNVLAWGRTIVIMDDVLTWGRTIVIRTIVIMDDVLTWGRTIVIMDDVLTWGRTIVIMDNVLTWGRTKAIMDDVLTWGRTIVIMDDVLTWGRTIVIMDDFLTWGRTMAEPGQRLKRDINKAREYNLKLSPSKCEFRRSEITYVEHTISSKGLKPDSDKVRAVEQMKAPTNKLELQTFLGFVQCLAKFLPNMPDLSATLRQVLHMEVEWHWENEQEKDSKH